MSSEIQTMDRGLEIKVKSPNCDKICQNNHPNENSPERLLVNVPEHIQNSLDCLLDFYTEQGLKPVITLTGNALDIVCEFINHIQNNLPESFISTGKDVIDFIIDKLCDHCRNNSIGNIDFNFEFNRKMSEGCTAC